MNPENDERPGQGAPAQQQQIDGNNHIPSGNNGQGNGDGHVDIDALMAKAAADLTTDELVAVKAELGRRAHLVEIAGEHKVAAGEKLQAIIQEIDPLSELELDLRAEDLCKKWGVSRTTLRMIWKVAHSQRETRKESKAPANDPRPVIVANNRDLKEISVESVTALAKGNNPPTLFKKGSELIRIVGGRVEPLSEYRLRHELARQIKYVEQTAKGAQSDCPPPLEVVRDIPAWPNLPFPEIVSILQGPFINSAGELVQAIGFHAKERVYIAQAVEVKPFEGTGKEAAEWIDRELLGDFPFKTAADRANAMGAIIVCLAREMIPGNVPLQGVDASIHGAGKGLLVDVATLPAFGPGGAELVSYSELDEEMRKRLTASLRHSPGALKIDNAKNGIDSPALASLLTTEEWTDRILGKNETVTIRVRVVVFAAVNQPSLTGEIARRYCPIRLTRRQKHRGCGPASDTRISWNGPANIAGKSSARSRAWWRNGFPPAARPGPGARSGASKPGHGPSAGFLKHAESPISWRIILRCSRMRIPRRRPGAP